MRKVLSNKLESGRLSTGFYASTSADGCNGAFVMMTPWGTTLRMIVSDASTAEAHGWEHVSVSLEHRVPDWREMCLVKSWFWEDEEAVIQFHPPESEYINHHPRCLHLWRHVDGHPTPPSSLVGPK